MSGHEQGTPPRTVTVKVNTVTMSTASVWPSPTTVASQNEDTRLTNGEPTLRDRFWPAAEPEAPPAAAEDFATEAQDPEEMKARSAEFLAFCHSAEERKEHLAEFLAFCEREGGYLEEVD